MFADMLETEYRLNNEFGMTFGMADQEYRKQLEAQRAMAVTLLIAPAIGSLADRMVNGSANRAYVNNTDDYIDRYGTADSKFTWKLPKNTKNPGGQPAGAGNPGKIVTKIKYRPSSGIIFKSNPRKTTTILGSYEKDMKNIVNEMGNEKSTYFGEKKGGFNVLNVPDDMYKDADQFWNEINKPWLDEVIKRGDDIVLATKPEGRVMQSFNKLTGEWGQSGFSREYQYLYGNGYRYDPVTNTMVK